MKVWRGTYGEYQAFKAMPDGLTIALADLLEIDELPDLPPAGSMRPCLGRVSISDEFGDLSGLVVVEGERDVLELVDAGDEPYAWYEGARKAWWDPGDGVVFVLEERD